MPTPEQIRKEYYNLIFKDDPQIDARLYEVIGAMSLEIATLRAIIEKLRKQK